MDFKVIDINEYYRKDAFNQFSKNCKCSVSITSEIDVTKLVAYSKKKGTKFYINFLYLISKVLNSRDDYKLCWDWKNEKVICWNKICPEHYVFHEDTETVTRCYTEYDDDYEIFYKRASDDIEKAKSTREYGIDAENHPNYFNASCIPWVSYSSLHTELPDGYLYLAPMIHWGKFEKTSESYKMPVTVRMNHAGADGYTIALVFKKLEDAIENFCK